MILSVSQDPFKAIKPPLSSYYKELILDKLIVLDKVYLDPKQLICCLSFVTDLTITLDNTNWNV